MVNSFELHLHNVDLLFLLTYLLSAYSSLRLEMQYFMWLRTGLNHLALDTSSAALWDSLVSQMVQNLPTMRETWFDPWVKKIPWRREWLPTPIFLPEELHGQRSLVCYSPWGRKESDRTEQLTHTHRHVCVHAHARARAHTHTHTHTHTHLAAF